MQQNNIYVDSEGTCNGFSSVSVQISKSPSAGKLFIVNAQYSMATTRLKTADKNLLPNELPAILQHGELVITPEQQRSIIGNLQHYAPVPFMDAGTCSEHSAANPIINNYNI